MKFVILIYFIILTIIPVLSQNIQFFREDLNFRLEENQFYVDGLYYFRNLTDQDVNRTLFYPFPADSIYGEVDSIFVVGFPQADINTNLKI